MDIVCGNQNEVVSIPDVMDSLTGMCCLPMHVHGPQPNKTQMKINKVGDIWLCKCWGNCAGNPSGQGDVIEFMKAMTGYDNRHVAQWFQHQFGNRLTAKRPKETAAPETKP